MSLKRYLTDLGYESISRTTFACSIGDLVHVVLLGRDRHGKDYVEIKIWHERFAIAGEPFRPRDLASPVRGMVGPEGVISSWTWNEVEGASEHIAKIVKGFSTCFGTFDDIKNAVGPVDTISPLWKQLYGECDGCDTNGERRLSSFRFEVAGSISKVKSLEIARNAFETELIKLGFKCAHDDHALTFFKDRGDIVDCVRFSADLFQTFGQLEVFPWSRLVWRAERRLKGRYIGITTRRTEDLASLWLRPIHEVGPASVDSALAWISEQLRAQQGVRSTADFIAAIDPMYSIIRSQLAMVSTQ